MGAQRHRTAAAPPGEPRFITFEPRETEPGRATRIWDVLTRGGEWLGTVSWYSQWRRYACFPAGNVVLEPQCLRDLADFCERETRAHKARRSGGNT